MKLQKGIPISVADLREVGPVFVADLHEVGPKFLGMARIAIMSAFFVFGIAGTAFAQDTDGDGMPDWWEIKFGLDSTNSTDAALDSDSDGLVNLNEYAASSDPFFPDTDRDGASDGADADPVSRAYIRWGDPLFTEADTYDYTAPAWVLGAYKLDGEWATNPISWYVPETEASGVGSLNVELDRNILTTNNVRYRLTFYDGVGGDLFMDLLATNGALLATDLFGNIRHGSGNDVAARLNVPLAAYTNAAVILMRRGSGETRVYESLLYVDEDDDGLDLEMEQQVETSDSNPDSDNDGLSDYDEVFVHGTDPTNPDTDGDGMPDGWEVLNGLNPNGNDASGDPDGDGVSNLAEYQQGRDPQAGAAADIGGIVALKIYTLLEK